MKRTIETLPPSNSYKCIYIDGDLIRSLNSVVIAVAICVADDKQKISNFSFQFRGQKLLGNSEARAVHELSSIHSAGVVVF